MLVRLVGQFVDRDFQDPVLSTRLRVRLISRSAIIARLQASAKVHTRVEISEVAGLSEEELERAEGACVCGGDF